MQADLRAFLQVLEQHGKLLRLRRLVDPRTELAALILEAERRHQAVLFEHVTGSNLPCVANVVGDREMLGLALNVPPEEVVSTFLSRSQQRIRPIRRDSGPVQEVVESGDEVDVRKLPLVV